MWKNREHIEEILFLLEKSHWPGSVCSSFLFGYFVLFFIALKLFEIRTPPCRYINLVAIVMVQVEESKITSNDLGLLKSCANE